MIGNLKDAGINIVSNIPKFTSVKSTLYRQRNKEAGVSKMLFKNALEVEVPPRYNNFLLADYSNKTNNTRIIVFSSVEARQITCESKEFYGDGTFRSCPSPFVQLYTIHVDTGSTINHTNITPVIYALMTNKTMQSYLILFQMIKSQLPDWNPTKFKLDYEKAAMNAIIKVFPTVIIKGCYYHYNKAIFKKGKSLNMTSRTSQDLKEVRIIELSAILPLLPENEIINGWVYIIARYGDSEGTGTKKFINYMEKQWLREEYLKVWCVFGDAHRTTNALESWHNKLNKTIGTKHPNIMHFLHTIEEDSSQNTVRNVLKQQGKPSKRKRGKKSISRDEFIQEAQLELTQGLISVGHALEILRH